MYALQSLNIAVTYINDRKELSSYQS